ncbi:hypothetical protein B0I35DRAFT_386447 [Stachybotrys elegans]|uniref:Peptide hydrolase n=1 Tax=Stachybotrys elegans TaxID=80388 RepID=A0A8K0WZ33_9HYPO|nr:hypothetical protein B0I35DRAFT_386447 [Stachybotrys elegans]
MKFSTLLPLGLAIGASANSELTPDKVEADIQTDKLQNVLWNLNKIARDNGGNRAFGFPGYNASIDFILERAVTRFGKHMDTYVQPFTALWESTLEIALTGPDGESVSPISTLLYNTGTPVPDGITAVLADTPIDDTRGSMCFADQWEGVDVEGKIALIKRGTCAIADKLKLAKLNGAVAAVLINNVPGNNIIMATLGVENYPDIVPVVVATYETGYSWKERIAAGETLEVNVLVDALVEERETYNIISETKEGDPNSVVMLGAHLDSVQAGPGVNDDGSGSAALLELMGSFKKYKGFKNKVRFAWWGAEESGLLGSLYYGSQLSEEEADKIKFYFNYDMIGSIAPSYAVYADNEAHQVGGSLLIDYLQANGADAYYGGFGSDSDYVAFLELGIPSSGIFTGAGAPEDPCYHLLCDNLENINWEAITLNTKAAGRAAAEFALNMDNVPPRVKASPNPRSKRGMAKRFDAWANVAKVVGKKHSCSRDGDLATV